MDTPDTSISELARELLAATPGQPDHSPVAVIDAFRLSLSRLAGVDGFTTLLRRALSLAAVDVAALKDLTVSPDGRLDGWEKALACYRREHAARDAAIAITSQLLTLLITFIGRPITMTLIHEAWPHLSLPSANSRTEAP